MHKSSFDHAEGENMTSGQLVSKYENVQRNEKTESHRTPTEGNTTKDKQEVPGPALEERKEGKEKH